MANLNGKLFNEAKAIANFGGRLAFAVSLGKDTACMLHIMNQLTDLKRHYFFHWSMYPKMLPYQSRYLSQIERMYGIKVDVSLWPELIKKKQAPAVTEIMEANHCDLALFAYRMDESLQRRGMLKRFNDGIDYVRKWAYPLRSFTAKSIRGYVTANKVPLNVEYSLGFKHDLLTHRGKNALLLRHAISEADYQAAVAQDPNVEIDYVRFANCPEIVKEIFGEKGLPKGRV